MFAPIQRAWRLISSRLTTTEKDPLVRHGCRGQRGPMPKERVNQRSSSSPARLGQPSPPTDAQPQAVDVNFWAVFESAPDAYLLLAPDPPRFTMVAANQARFKATLTQPSDVIGHPLFEVFPDNPTDPAATGVRNLQLSLMEVIQTGKPHRMALQQPSRSSLASIRRHSRAPGSAWRSVGELRDCSGATSRSRASRREGRHLHYGFLEPSECDRPICPGPRRTTASRAPAVDAQGRRGYRIGDSLGRPTHPAHARCDLSMPPPWRRLFAVPSPALRYRRRSARVSGFIMPARHR